jgi:hypothetical protein
MLYFKRLVIPDSGMKRRSFSPRLKVAVLATLLPLAANADQSPGLKNVPDGSLNPTLRAGSLLSADKPRARFDITLNSLAVTPVDEESPLAGNALQVYGGLAEQTQSETGQQAPADQSARLSNILGFSWQHRLDSKDSLALSAEYGQNVRPNQFAQDTLESRAMVSWTRQWGMQSQPSLTGSVFVGDEMARDESYRQLGRRYMGFAVGGQMTLAKSHTPYLAYQLRRSYYDGENGGLRFGGLYDDSLPSSRPDDRSLFTAGYRWQASRSLSLQAEASYGLNSDGQDLYNQERTRLFFGTRFDFR